MSISEGFDGVKQEKILVAAKIDWDVTTRFELLKSSQAGWKPEADLSVEETSFQVQGLRWWQIKRTKNRETYSNFSTTILFLVQEDVGSSPAA